jgi:integral membrane protein (TIGR01906 family)
MKQKKQNKTIIVLIAASFFFLVLFTPLLFYAYSPTHYYSQLKKNDVPQTIQEKSSTYFASNIAQYLKNSQELDSSFTENEKNHMNDVKKIFDIIEILIFISAIIIITSTITKKIPELKKGIKYGAIATIIFIALILISVFFSFQSLFTFMHTILFPQGNWMFDESSILITVLPEQFFINTAIYSFTITFIASAIILISFFILDKYNKTREKTRKK